MGSFDERTVSVNGILSLSCTDPFLPSDAERVTPDHLRSAY